jgi:hypothetical protein
MLWDISPFRMKLMRIMIPITSSDPANLFSIIRSLGSAAWSAGFDSLCSCFAVVVAVCLGDASPPSASRARLCKSNACTGGPGVAAQVECESAKFETRTSQCQGSRVETRRFRDHQQGDHPGGWVGRVRSSLLTLSYIQA